MALLVGSYSFFPNYKDEASWERRSVLLPNVFFREQCGPPNLEMHLVLHTSHCEIDAQGAACDCSVLLLQPPHSDRRAGRSARSGCPHCPLVGAGALLHCGGYCFSCKLLAGLSWQLVHVDKGVHCLLSGHPCLTGLWNLARARPVTSQFLSLIPDASMAALQLFGHIDLTLTDFVAAFLLTSLAQRNRRKAAIRALLAAIISPPPSPRHPSRASSQRATSSGLGIAPLAASPFNLPKPGKR